MTAALYEALDYLLDAVGDNKVEGEVNKLRHQLFEEWDNFLNLGEDELPPGHAERPAKVSDEYGDPRQKLEAARAQLRAAQAAVDEAERNAGQGPPPGTHAVATVQQGVAGQQLVAPAAPAPAAAPAAAAPDDRDARLAALRAQLAAQQAAAAPDPRDDEIAQLEAQLAAGATGDVAPAAADGAPPAPAL